MRIPTCLDVAKVRERVLSASGVILFCDFDGTLVPIKNHPGECRLDSNVRDVLTSLTAHPNCHAAIISGRPISDLTARVGVPEIGYAGNHGLEIRFRGEEFTVPVGAEFRKAIDAVLPRVRADLERFAGAWVEDKKLSITAHYRQVAESDKDEARSVIERSLKQIEQHGGGEMRFGKMVVELRPPGGSNKGTATRWIAGRCDPAGECIVVYIGDDDTDEDAFAAWPEGITVRVGEPRESKAAYRLESPAEVHGFLNQLKLWLIPDGRRQI